MNEEELRALVGATCELIQSQTDPLRKRLDAIDPSSILHSVVATRAEADLRALAMRSRAIIDRKSTVLAGTPRGWTRAVLK